MRILFIVILGVLLSDGSFAQPVLRGSHDTLFLLYKGAADSVFYASADLFAKLSPQENNTVWKGAIPVKQVDQLMTTYRFDVYHNGVKTTSQGKEWIGSAVSPLSPRVKRIKGQLLERSLRSESLNEDRALTIYLPPKYNDKIKYPAVYLTDGKIVEDYAPYVEYLIRHKKLPALVMVGVHAGVSSRDLSKDRRGLEYNKGFSRFVKGSDSLAFDKHMHFFSEEVIHYVENNFSVDPAREKRMLFGYSNGASFAVSAGVYHPLLFGNIIAASIGWLNYIDDPVWDTTIYPRYHVTAGNLEPDFLKTSIQWTETLRKAGKEFYFTQFNAGHDMMMWRTYFLQCLQEICSTISHH